MARAARGRARHLIIPPGDIPYFCLAENEWRGDVEVLRIDSATETVRIRMGDQEMVLSFSDSPSQAKAAIGNSYVRLEDCPLRLTLEFYSRLASRPAIQHPDLKPETLTLKAAVTNRTQATRVLEKALEDKGIKAVPAGDKFALIVPAVMAEKDSLHSFRIPPKLWLRIWNDGWGMIHGTNANPFLPGGRRQLSGVGVAQRVTGG